MDLNKENHRLTKIPLPLHPLPPVPRHLTIGCIKKIEADRVAAHHTRIPLRTLNSEAGSSRQLIREHSTPLKADRHVTRRNRGDDKLDWHYQVFRDNDKVKQSITISDDEDERKTKHFHRKTRQFSALHDVNLTSEPPVKLKPVTPLKTAYLESTVIKNIKKSLKRPHSRELAGLSPVGKGRKGDDGRVSRRLSRGRLCDRLKSPDQLTSQYTGCLNRDYVTEVFRYLLSKERRPETELRIPGLARSCVLNWLMKVNGPDGDPAVLQSASWYLDSILAKEEVHIEKLQLVGSACFWIAQKVNQAPAPAHRLVKYSNFYFSAKQLLDAERAVLKSLNFPPQPIISYEYISYLAWWCDECQPGEIEVSATFLSMAGALVNKKWSADYPSVVAAAAVRNALLLLRRKDLVIKLKGCSVYRAAEAKAANFEGTCSAQRLAIRIVANPKFDYRTPFEQYGSPPLYLAQKLVKAATQMALLGQ